MKRIRQRDNSEVEDENGIDRGRLIGGISGIGIGIGIVIVIIEMVDEERGMVMEGDDEMIPCIM